MQWQLDRRTREAAASPSSNRSRHKEHKQRLVFHERHDRHSKHTSKHRSPLHKLQPYSSSSSSSVDAGSSSVDESQAASTADHTSVLSEQQQQQQVGSDSLRSQEDEQFYCLQLDHAIAVQDLHKAQERLARHIQQDGGCCLSASVGRASTLTHLLLLLQQKQLHRQEDTVLLLQPLSCDSPSAAAASSSAAGPGDQHQQASQRAGHSRSSVLQPGLGGQQLSCACSADELSFFATFMPLHTLLSVERCSTGTQAAAGAAAPPAIHTPGGLTGRAAAELVSSGTWESVDAARASIEASGSGMRSWSGAESSSEEHRTPRTSSSSRHSKQHRANSALLQAADSSSSGVAAVLADAVARGCLQSLRVGPHADVEATAASIKAAVKAGQVLSLHVQDQAAAHSVSYAALDLAYRELQSAAQQPASFGVLLVEGQSHEHVHATPHKYSSAVAMDMQHGGAAGVAAAAGAVQHHHQHTGRPADASMDVGGIGAAFYGLGGYGDRSSQQQQQGVLHKRGQAVWLCVVPLSVVA